MSPAFWTLDKSRITNPSARLPNDSGPTSRQCRYSYSESKRPGVSEKFQSVFTNEITGDIREKKSVPWPSVVENITFDTEGINKLLNNLDPKKACGPDLLPTRILKEAATEIAQILQLIFKKSFENAELPKDWLTANIIAIHKKDNRN